MMYKIKTYNKPLNSIIEDVFKILDSDVKLLTTVPPYLIRILSSDNVYRTFMLKENGTKTDIVTTKTTDTVDHIDDMVKICKFDVKPDEVDPKEVEATELKEKSLLHYNKLEAEFYSKKKSGEFTKEQVKVELDKLKALKERVENGEVIGVTPKIPAKKKTTKATKKKKTRKKVKRK